MYTTMGHSAASDQSFSFFCLLVFSNFFLVNDDITPPRVELSFLIPESGIKNDNSRLYQEWQLQIVVVVNLLLINLLGFFVKKFRSFLERRRWTKGNCCYLDLLIIIVEYYFLSVVVKEDATIVSVSGGAHRILFSELWDNAQGFLRVSDLVGSRSSLALFCSLRTLGGCVRRYRSFAWCASILAYIFLLIQTKVPCSGDSTIKSVAIGGMKKGPFRLCIPGVLDAVRSPWHMMSGPL